MPKKKKQLANTKAKNRSRQHTLSGFRLYCIAMIIVGSIGLNLTQPVSSHTQQQAVQQIVPVTIQRSVPPVHVTIGSLIDQPIEEHFMSETGMPTISSDHVSHFSNSAMPGDNGNMILYGHNQWKILARLHSVKLGESISIKAADGKQYTYTVTAIETVETTNTSWLEQTDNPVVTIYTCTGWMDSLRLVVRGELVM